MSANNQLLIKKDKEGYWAYDMDVDCKNVLTEPIASSDTLKGITRLAQDYLNEIDVEYGLSFDKSALV